MALKIVDFGFGALLSPAVELDIAVGTLKYFAPEMVARVPYTAAIDMWACGYEFLSYLFLSVRCCKYVRVICVMRIVVFVELYCIACYAVDFHSTRRSEKNCWKRLRRPSSIARRRTLPSWPMMLAI